MEFRIDERADDFEEVDRFDGGVGWIAHPEEGMRRASHALAVDGEVWLVDPVDAAGLDDLLAEFGEVAGVVVTMDRHGRDAGEIAQRHGVPVSVPAFVDPALDGSPRVERFTGELADTGFRVRRVVNLPGWSEAALSDGESLVVGDALGTASHFCAGEEPLGVHPFLRVSPPAAFREYDPARVLVGHGAGVHGDAAAVLTAALDTARRGLPRAWLGALRSFL
jgi:hypothetical protein